MIRDILQELFDDKSGYLDVLCLISLFIIHSTGNLDTLSFNFDSKDARNIPEATRTCSSLNLKSFFRLVTLIEKRFGVVYLYGSDYT